MVGVRRLWISTIPAEDTIPLEKINRIAVMCPEETKVAFVHFSPHDRRVEVEYYADAEEDAANFTVVIETKDDDVLHLNDE